VAVTIGGIEALRMDVVAAPGASVCDAIEAPQVLTPGDDGGWYYLDAKLGHRMRLYLVDLPEGSSTRILAIAVNAPVASFERVVELAGPVVDSLEFHTR
jgi:hypothetical protein